MLVLSRKVGDQIVIGDNITVTVVRFPHGGVVQLGIDAPKDVTIRCEELPPMRPEDKPATPRIGPIDDGTMPF